MRVPLIVLLFLSSLSVQAATSGLSSMLLIPVAGSTPGLFGTAFQTDVTLRNGLNTPQFVQLTFLPAERVDLNARFTHLVVEMGPLATRTVENVAAALRLRDPAIGAILVTGTADELGDASPSESGARLDAAYRIYTSSPLTGGTTSQSSEAVDLTDSTTFTAGTATGLLHNAFFRTNVGIVNLAAGTPRLFHVIATSIETKKSITFDVLVPPMSMVQRAVPLTTALDATAVRVEASGISDHTARWSAYASSVDNVTGDSWLEMITAE